MLHSFLLVLYLTLLMLSDPGASQREERFHKFRLPSSNKGSTQTQRKGRIKFCSGSRFFLEYGHGQTTSQVRKTTSIPISSGIYTCTAEHDSLCYPEVNLSVMQANITSFRFEPIQKTSWTPHTNLKQSFKFLHLNQSEPLAKLQRQQKTC